MPSWHACREGPHRQDVPVARSWGVAPRRARSRDSHLHDVSPGHLQQNASTAMAARRHVTRPRRLPLVGSSHRVWLACPSCLCVFCTGPAFAPGTNSAISLLSKRLRNSAPRLPSPLHRYEPPSLSLSAIHVPEGQTARAMQRSTSASEGHLGLVIAVCDPTYVCALSC